MTVVQALALELLTEALADDYSGVDDAAGVATFLASWLDAAGYVITSRPGHSLRATAPGPAQFGHAYLVDEAGDCSSHRRRAFADGTD